MSDDNESGGGGPLGDIEGLGDITGGLGEGLEGVSGLLDEGSEGADVVGGITEGLAGLNGMLGGGEGGGGEAAEAKGGGGGLVGGIAGGLAGGADKLSEMLGEGEDTKDLRAAIDTAGGIAEGVKAGAEVADTLGKLGGAISGGDIGKSASGIGDALGSAGAGVGAITGALGEVVPEELREGFREASKVANSVGQIARGVGQLVEGVSDLLEDLLGQRKEVEAHLSVAGEDVEWHVHSAHFSDAVGALTSCSVDARAPKDSALDEEELLSKAAHLSLERGDEHRSIRGIIRQAHVSRRAEHTAVHLEIVPAAWTLTQIVDSRVYQDVSVPDLVERIMREALDGQRSVRKDLTETYTPAGVTTSSPATCGLVLPDGLALVAMTPTVIPSDRLPALRQRGITVRCRPGASAARQHRRPPVLPDRCGSTLGARPLVRMAPSPARAGSGRPSTPDGSGPRSGAHARHGPPRLPGKFYGVLR